MNELIKEVIKAESSLFKIMLGIIVILLLIIVSNYLSYLFYKKKKDILKEGSVISSFYTIDKLYDRMYIVVDSKTKIPVFISESLDQVLQLNRERLKYDLEYLFVSLFGEIQAKKEWTNYIVWNGTDKIEKEIEVGNTSILLDIINGFDGHYDIFTFEDQTKEKDKEKQLMEEIKQMGEISDSKTAFLSRMSHEIRTPMNGIIGMLILAKQKLQPEDELMYYINQADVLSLHLLSLINDILDMSRIEAGKLELDNQPFRIRDLGDKLSSLFKKNIEAKGVDFRVEYYGIGDEYVLGDELRLSQVLSNFLSNAQKFTKSGEIVVTFRLMQRTDDSMDLMLRVHDTGIGMAPEFINHIFKPFEQESTQITKNYGGSGLGMAIADQIISLMGGEIVVDSKEGQGSDFSVFINLKISDKAYVPLKKENTFSTFKWNFKGKHVLYAEDNEINAEIGCSILEAKGAIVDHVEDGNQAVEVFANHDINYYDCILMDIQMPGLDGRSAARKIRALDRMDAKSIPMFALSADAFVEDQRLSLGAGMDGHFEKPANFEQIEKAIQEFLMKKQQSRNGDEQ